MLIYNGNQTHDNIQICKEEKEATVHVLCHWESLHNQGDLKDAKPHTESNVRERPLGSMGTTIDLKRAEEVHMAVSILI